MIDISRLWGSPFGSISGSLPDLLLIPKLSHNIEKLLVHVGMASLKASVEGLKIVDRARQRMGWTKTRTVAWWQNANTSQATLKRFWRRLAIQEANFIDICKAVGLSNWETVSERYPDEEVEVEKLPKSGQYWGESPDISGFYGRNRELEILEKWIIQDRCRLVVLSGMVGIGKTALSVMLADRIQDGFDYVIWRSLRYAPSVSDILEEVVIFLGNGQETDLPEEMGRRVSLLMKYLKNYRCLLILDEVQTILSRGDSLRDNLTSRTGQYGAGYEGYSEIFQRIGDQFHQSCLVITSQEKPQDIISREGETRPVRCLKLEGLLEGDAQQIFRDKGLLDPSYWGTLNKIYRGNPLWLNIVAASIKASFNGSVYQFLELNTIFLGDIRSLLDLSFERLSPLEKEIVNQLATDSQPISIVNLQEKFAQLSCSELIEAIESLDRHALIEKQIEGNTVLYTLQPVVRRYIIRH